MSDEPEQPPVTHLPSLLDVKALAGGSYATPEEALFYTCPQCGGPMVTKKCKIVCYKCHYFIGCVE